MINTMLDLRYSHVTGGKVSQEELDMRPNWDRLMEEYRVGFPNIYVNGDSAGNKISLTFDDAPDRQCTPLILDILKEYQVPAVFAAHGRHTEEDADILLRVHKEGHEIINHTYDHLSLPQIGQSRIKEEILRTEAIIFELTGKRTCLMRPPYGKLSREVFATVADLDYGILMWSYNTYDFVATQKEEILEGMTEAVRPGEIILMHSYENKEPTVEALETIITDLRTRGFHFVPITELLGIDCYRVSVHA